MPVNDDRLLMTVSMLHPLIGAESILLALVAHPLTKRGPSNLQPIPSGQKASISPRRRLIYHEEEPLHTLPHLPPTNEKTSSLHEPTVEVESEDKSSGEASI